jgi:hypothetical protein
MEKTKGEYHMTVGMGLASIISLSLAGLLKGTNCRVYWENSLFDTSLNLASLFGPGKIFLPHLTLCLNFFPYVPLPSILLGTAVTFALLRSNYPQSVWHLGEGKENEPAWPDEVIKKKKPSTCTTRGGAVGLGPSGRRVLLCRVPTSGLRKSCCMRQIG